MRRPRRIVYAAALVAYCTAGLLAATRGVAAPTHTGAAQKTTITVVMMDFHFRLSKTKNVPRGTVVFKLVNKGKVPHNFRIAGKTSKLIAPGKSGTLTVVFTKKGSYTYLCTVPGHAKLGM